MVDADAGESSMVVLDSYVNVGSLVRVSIMCLGIVAAGFLWKAKKTNSGVWTPKMRDIWIAHFLFVDCSITANAELLIRHVHPTITSGLLVVALCWSIKGSSQGTPYTQRPGQ